MEQLSEVMQEVGQNYAFIMQEGNELFELYEGYSRELQGFEYVEDGAISYKLRRLLEEMWTRLVKASKVHVQEDQEEKLFLWGELLKRKQETIDFLQNFILGLESKLEAANKELAQHERRSPEVLRQVLNMQHKVSNLTMVAQPTICQREHVEESIRKTLEGIHKVVTYIDAPADTTTQQLLLLIEDGAKKTVSQKEEMTIKTLSYDIEIQELTDKVAAFESEAQALREQAVKSKTQVSSVQPVVDIEAEIARRVAAERQTMIEQKMAETKDMLAQLTKANNEIKALKEMNQEQDTTIQNNMRKLLEHEFEIEYYKKELVTKEDKLKERHKSDIDGYENRLFINEQANRHKLYELQKKLDEATASRRLAFSESQSELEKTTNGDLGDAVQRARQEERDKIEALISEEVRKVREEELAKTNALVQEEVRKARDEEGARTEALIQEEVRRVRQEERAKTETARKAMEEELKEAQTLRQGMVKEFNEELNKVEASKTEAVIQASMESSAQTDVLIQKLKEQHMERIQALSKARQRQKEQFAMIMTQQRKKLEEDLESKIKNIEEYWNFRCSRLQERQQSLIRQIESDAQENLRVIEQLKQAHLRQKISLQNQREKDRREQRLVREEFHRQKEATSASKEQVCMKKVSDSQRKVAILVEFVNMIACKRLRTDSMSAQSLSEQLKDIEFNVNTMVKLMHGPDERRLWYLHDIFSRQGSKQLERARNY